MNVGLQRTISFLTIALLWAALELPAQRPRVSGWEPLFNGRDLSGWTTIGKERWVVEDGTIYGEAVTEGDGFLKTVKTYKDAGSKLRPES